MPDDLAIHLSPRDWDRFVAALEDEGAKPNEALLRSVERYHDVVAARRALIEAEMKCTIPWEQVKAELGL